jgi:RNA recognition motif-containing protein
VLTVHAAMNTYTLHVLGLPPQANAEALRYLFLHFGTVNSARIVRDPDGNSIGLGVVEMSSLHDVEEILNTKDGLQMGGTRLIVWKRLERIRSESHSTAS